MQTLPIVDLWQCCACYLINIKSNPMQPLSGALPLPNVPARVTLGALVGYSTKFGWS